MENPNRLKPGRIFFVGLAILAYAIISILIIGVVSPAMVSSTNTLAVVAGFILPLIWLVISGCLVISLIQSCSNSKSVQTMEKHQ